MDEMTARLFCSVVLLICCIPCTICKLCGSEFEDIQSRAVFANVVAEGTVEIKYTKVNIGGMERYNASVTIHRVLKGQLSGGHRRKIIDTVKIGEYGSPMDKESCITAVNESQKYIFFLRTTTDPNFYRQDSFPVISSKLISRKIRSVLCPDCADAPRIRPVKDLKVVEGKSVKINCRVKGKPKPIVIWTKNGKVLKKRRGLQIRDNKRGSTLRFRRTKVKDAGPYTCIAKNILGEVRQEIFLAVNPSPELPISTTPEFISSTISSTTLESETKPPKITSTTSTQAPTPKPTTPSVDKNVTAAPTGHYYPCEKQTYCLNGGTCIYIPAIRASFCKCTIYFAGTRCQERSGAPIHSYEDRLMDRTATVLGITIGLLVLIAICILSFILARKKRKAFFKRQAWKKRFRDNVISECRTNEPKQPPTFADARIPPKVLRMDSSTQTEALSPVDLDSLFPVMRSGATSRPLSEEQNGRPRLNGISGSPKPDVRLNTHTVPVIIESDQGSKDSSPSQSSKTESTQQRWRYSSEDANSRPGSCHVDNDQLSDYENNDSDLENKLSCVPAYASMDSRPIAIDNGNRPIRDDTRVPEHQPYIMSNPRRGSQQDRLNPNARQGSIEDHKTLGMSSTSSSDSDDSSLSDTERDVLLHHRAKALQANKGPSEHNTGSLTWDEYGNALPKYRADIGRAFNPYAIEDDLIDGSKYLHHQNPHFRNYEDEQRQRLLNVKENQDAVPL